MVRFLPENGAGGRGGIEGVGFEAALHMLVYEHDTQVAKLEAEMHKMRDFFREVEMATNGVSEKDGRSSAGPRGRARPPPYLLAAPIGYNDAQMQALSPRSPQATWPSEAESSEAPQRKTLGLIESVVKGLSQENVAHSYSGWASQLRHDPSAQLLALDSVIGFVIVLNTVLIGVSSDVSPEWIGWLVVDAIFAAIFLFETIGKIHMIGMRNFLMGPDRVMNLFEAGLVLMAIFETAIACIQTFVGGDDESTQLMSLFRVLRLCRVIRVLRVMRLEIFSEVKAMIRGTLGGMRTLLWSTVLIVLPVYGVSLVLRESIGTLDETGFGAEYFESVPRAFFSVFRCIVIGECADTGGRPLFVVVAESYGWEYGFLYSFIAVFMSFGLFNVIVAMFVENVVEASKQRDRIARKERLRDKTFFGQKMAELLVIVEQFVNPRPSQNGATCEEDETDDNIFTRAVDIELTPELFNSLRLLPGVQEILDALDVADDDQHNLFETLDADGGGTIDMEELCNGISKLRGDPCRSDIISINFKLQNVQEELQCCTAAVLRRLHSHDEILGKISETLGNVSS
eukprot:TRINITY_DN12113_c0_g1_i1.p1 TRINITY_DN12113_c0_g1~~TRINITY_DN12113_c0_g1_i1.p1  ORF type:complete len:570 (-),score=74.29 TRINITY_DN12113_c0_g1_i1:555-2264(-)